MSRFQSSYFNPAVNFKLQFSNDLQPISTEVFSRNDYLRRIQLSNESISLIVISTYRLDLNELSEDFPHIFGMNTKNVIPTLVLHGDKDAYVCEVSFDVDGRPLTKSIARKEITSVGLRSDPYDSEEDYVYMRRRREELEKMPWSRSKTQKQHVFSHIDLVHIYEVLPQWSSSSRVSFADSGEKNSASTKETVTPRNAIPGVHHPKYMLVFTTLGLHVVVSTANLSSQRSTDLTWSQFFPLSSEGSNANDQNEIGSDFGTVLQDFVQKQLEQIVLQGNGGESSSRPDLTGFICRHAAFGKGQSLATTYDFSQAKVDLLSVVPGRDALSPLSSDGVRWLYQNAGRDPDLVSATPCKVCVARSRRLRKPTRSHKCGADSTSITGVGTAGGIRYGMQRVRELLIRNEHLLARPLTAQDTLIVQPTSIGLRIDNYYIDSLLCHYMPEGLWEEQYEALRQDSWRLVWPSADFVKCLARHRRVEEEEEVEEDTSGGDDAAACGLFLHPRSFAAMEFDIHAQFRTYEASLAPLVSRYAERLPPHNKSYLRVMARAETGGETQSAISPSEVTKTESAFVELKAVCVEASQGDLGISRECCVWNECKEEPQGDLLQLVDFPFTQLTPPTALLLDIKEEIELASDGTSSTEHDDDEDEDELVCSRMGYLSDGSFHANVSTLTSVVKEEKNEEKEKTCTCCDLAWCVLTSACLSRGAQGEEVPYGLCTDCGHIQTGYVEYRNFELGVMFHSRPGLQYRALSGKCPIHGQGSKTDGTNQLPSVVVLPLPYEVLGGEAYCSEGGALLHRPFFHENQEANKYTVSQKLPDAPPLPSHTAIKRSATWDDGMGRRRHSELLAQRAVFICKEGETTLMPQSLMLPHEKGGDVMGWQDQPATRAKTTGSFVSSKQSDKWLSGLKSTGSGQQNMNITDFLC